MKKLLILAFSCLAFAGTIHAQCAGTTTCGPINGDQASVSAALNSVNLENTTITINSGTWHWTTGINFTVAHSTSLIGATLCPGPPSTSTCTDNTVMIDDVNHNVSGAPDATWVFSIPAGKSFRWSGITAQTGTAPTSNNGVFTWGGGTTQLRIDHSHFAISANVTWTIFGETFGVVDHCVIAPNNTGPRVVGGGNSSWINASGMGTSSAIYFEDNYITGSTQLNDNYQGGRNVYRFNTINNMSGQTHPLGHDGTAGNDRGGRLTEMYQNKFTAPSCSGSGGTCKFNIMFHSAGTGAYWGNNNPFISSSAGGGWNFFLTTHSMRENSSTYTQQPTPAGWGYCGTQFNGTGSNWDENTSGTTGYHCIDDPGRGRGDLLSGSHPNKVNSTTGCGPSQACAYPRQASEPIYAGWLENFNPSNATGAAYYLDQSIQGGISRVVRNADIFLFQDCATGAGAQTAGVCVGTLASRQTNCTAGVGYWATDQGNWNTSGGSNINSYAGNGVLYQCNPANTWTAYYTPLTYPHPLVNAPAPIATFSPTSLNVGFAPVGVVSNPSSTITLTNTGTANLVVTGITSNNGTFSGVNNTCGASGTFSQASPGAGFTLTPSQSCTFQVTMQIGAVGPVSGGITLFDNTGNADGMNLTGAGTGVPAPGNTFAGILKSSGTVTMR